MDIQLSSCDTWWVNITIAIAMPASSRSLKTIPSNFTTCFFAVKSNVPKTMIRDGVQQLVYHLSVQDDSSAASINTGFFWKRYVDGHLVCVKVGIVGFTDKKWVQAKGYRSDEGSKGLDAQTVKGRCAVQSTGCSLITSSVSQIRSSPRYYRKRFALSRFALLQFWFHASRMAKSSIAISRPPTLVS